jgi:hypothetical protein
MPQCNKSLSQPPQAFVDWSRKCQDRRHPYFFMCIILDFEESSASSRTEFWTIPNVIVSCCWGFDENYDFLARDRGGSNGACFSKNLHIGLNISSHMLSNPSSRISSQFRGSRRVMILPSTSVVFYR